MSSPLIRTNVLDEIDWGFENDLATFGQQKTKLMIPNITIATDYPIPIRTKPPHSCDGITASLECAGPRNLILPT
jgi:alpha-N-acetylglucosamine transferase